MSNISANETAHSIATFHLKEAEFKKICRIVYSVCGIDLHEGKEELVKSRLSKRLRALNINSFENYLTFIEKEPSKKELNYMVDILTTNKTYFFRESQHFDLLKQKVIPKLDHSKIRFWSAGCSSGEEPYTLSILLREEIPDIDKIDVKILATDISSRVLEKANSAVYEKEAFNDLPQAYLRKYFTSVGSNSHQSFRVNENIMKTVYFAQLNLMEQWPMAGKFDVIFCRNVMIYFDRPTREKLINRFWDYLVPGGYLFVGHSESLTGLSHQFGYVQPAVYIKSN
ncbi:MAG: protein-glutamate O-methyltransferase [Candidatus Schekmanbacteria bacterium]|nr:protein-glutamate O-methyltransferase [Candidatus Schekmanbacteria bacterium]